MTPVADLYAPEAGSVLVDALHWIEGVMLGPIAVALAVAGVAIVGLLLLQGRVPWQRGLAVIVGCFIVFGARPVLQAAGNKALPSDFVAGQEGRLAPSAAQTMSPQAFDPYAGASLGN